MAGEIQLNSTTMATESSGSITAEVDRIRPNTTNGSLILQGDSSDAGVTGLTIDSSGNATFAQTISGGTIGSSVTFPAGHIVQSVFNPTLSTDLTATSGDTEKVVASATGQITITSGNGVLLIVQAIFQTNATTTSTGQCRLREGLTTSGTQLTLGFFGDYGSTFTFATPTLVAYDSSPADTTPDYCLTLLRNATTTSSCQMLSIQQFFLFEVQQ